MLPARMAYNTWTPERIERLTALVQRGCDIGSIMADPVLDPSSPQSYATWPRGSAFRCQKRHRAGRRLTDVHLSQAHWTQLKRFAALRRISAGALAERILSTVLNDQLVDAVLDDEDTRRISPARAMPGKRRKRPTADRNQREADEIAHMVAGGADVLDAIRKIAEGAVM
jgi:hypothetical protein